MLPAYSWRSGGVDCSGFAERRRPRRELGGATPLLVVAQDEPAWPEVAVQTAVGEALARSNT